MCRWIPILDGRRPPDPAQAPTVSRSWMAGGVGGAFIDSCYVHEQNVNYCSGQSMPNCVGWSPLESGSQKWGYTTAITTPTGKSLTPQQAFSRFYFSEGSGVDAVLIDTTALQANTHCVYQGKPVY